VPHPLHAESSNKENYIGSREIKLACSLVRRDSDYFHSSFFTVAIYQKVCIRDREKKIREREWVFANGVKHSDVMKSSVFFECQCVWCRPGGMANLSRSIHEHWN